MKRLSKYEKLTLFLAIVAFSANITCIFVGLQVGSQLSSSALILLILILAVLMVVRIDRIEQKQLKERKEIYQVLYEVQANSGDIEYQGRKTREHLARHSERSVKFSERLASAEKSETEAQARKTREHLSRNSQKLQRDLEKTVSGISELVKLSGRTNAADQTTDDLQNLAEVFRLRSNTLTAQLDAHWGLLLEISNNRTNQSRFE